MIRRNLIITGCLVLLGSLHLGAEKTITVPCGDWVQLEATPYEDCYFVQWSDGNTDAIRQIQVNENATYVAFFASHCSEYANLPVLVLYDWLIMLNVRLINEMGFYFAEKDVTWYRIVGEPDKLFEDGIMDDEKVSTGYYLTIDRNFYGSGDYYAIIDMGNYATGELCDGIMRSQIIQYSNQGHRSQPYLNKSIVHSGESIYVKGLNPFVQSQIRVIDAVGHVIADAETEGQDDYMLEAAYTSGCYFVVVWSESEQTTLRYMVSGR